MSRVSEPIAQAPVTNMLWILGWTQLPLLIKKNLKAIDRVGDLFLPDRTENLRAERSLGLHGAEGLWLGGQEGGPPAGPFYEQEPSSNIRSSGGRRQGYSRSCSL